MSPQFHLHLRSSLANESTQRFPSLGDGWYWRTLMASFDCLCMHSSRPVHVHQHRLLRLHPIMLLSCSPRFRRICRALRCSLSRAVLRVRKARSEGCSPIVIMMRESHSHRSFIPRLGLSVLWEVCCDHQCNNGASDSRLSPHENGSLKAGCDLHDKHSSIRQYCEDLAIMVISSGT